MKSDVVLVPPVKSDEVWRPLVKSYVVLEVWRHLVKSDVVLEVWRPLVRCGDPW